jgi:hypothetical protein
MIQKVTTYWSATTAKFFNRIGRYSAPSGIKRLKNRTPKCGDMILSYEGMRFRPMKRLRFYLKITNKQHKMALVVHTVVFDSNTLKIKATIKV